MPRLLVRMMPPPGVVRQDGLPPPLDAKPADLAFWPLHIALLALTAVRFVVFAVLLPDLPERVPTHRDGAGWVDAWAPRDVVDAQRVHHLR